MIRPAKFGYNEETAKSNSYQKNDNTPIEEIHQRALKEFDHVVLTLKHHNINVLVIEDTIEPHTPDAIFPNNWLSTHENKIFITWAMESPIRRLEIREDILRKLETVFGFNKEYNFQHYIEEDGLALEGTGSMVLDRENKIVYACLSSRTDIQLLSKFGVLMNYRIIYFTAVDQNNKPIYHTNVMMALGEKLAILCSEAIEDPEDRAKVIRQLEYNDKTIVDINLEQVSHYAGNMLELRSEDLTRYMIMSETAKKSLSQEQIESITQFSQIITVSIPTIQKYGGGSIRCMLTEIFHG